MELIQGLHVDVPGTEMKTLFDGRLRYHQDKVEKLERQLGEFKKIDALMAEEANNIGKMSNSAGPAQSIEQSIKRHKDQTIYYRFMVEHVVVSATYRISQSELVTLGIQPERHY